jgi:hypothetical protein
MNEVEALHTLARRYLAGRWEYWIEAYSPLPHSRGFRLSYSVEELSVFPRYNIAQEIVDEVERYVPADFDDLGDARARLIACGRSALDSLHGAGGAIEARAVAEELRSFEDYLEDVNDHDLSVAEPLPFRRRLSDEEVERWRIALEETWGVEDWNWHPDLRVPFPEGIEVYAERNGWMSGSVDIQIFGPVFTELSGGRYFELNRGGSGRSREIEGLDQTWDGDWGGSFYVASEASWLVHASHDYAIAVAGESAQESLRRHFSGWKDAICWPDPVQAP